MAGPDSGPGSGPAGRWSQLLLLSIAVLLALAPWFSAAAVAPSLAAEFGLSPLGVASLTVGVQIGFAVGALALAASGAVDIVPARWLIGTGAVAAALANAAFALVADEYVVALALRALAGGGIAAVYPVALKVLAGWFREDRGLAIGVLIGALTLGSALPHGLRAAGALVGIDWRAVILAGSVAGIAGGVIGWASVTEGPFSVPGSRFTPRLAAAALREPAVRLANLGYLGHMWELYAMWTWVPAFLAASLAASAGVEPAGASVAAFTVVAAGAIGCVVAGAIADRLGRTAVTSAAMAASGGSALLIGLLFGAPAWLVVGVAVVWGVTVVADSAQFSTAVSELAPRGTAGSALAVQTAAGFLLTAVTILAIGFVAPDAADGWRLAFWLLALGPAVGIAAMLRLRARPEATQMAGGRR